MCSADSGGIIRSRSSLLVGGLARRLRHVGGLDFLLQVVDFRRTRIALSQLLLNRLELLAQIELTLIFVELGLHLALDLMPQFEQFDLSVENRAELFQPGLVTSSVEQQVLLFLDRDLQVGRDQVGQAVPPR